MLFLVFTLSMAGCGGSGSKLSINTDTISVTVSGLDQPASLVLQDNGGDNLPISANGSYPFPTKVFNGSPYDVTVFTQPTNNQICTVVGGSGTAASNIINVMVNCTDINVLPLKVDGGPLPATYPTANVPYISVQICTPGGSICQTIDHVIVDTGSSGLRIISSVLSSRLALTQQTATNGEPLAECQQFADGYTWGSVKSADVKLGGEPVIRSLAIQVIGDPNFPNVPGSCSSTGPSENTVQTFGGNGILGVSVFQQDCGSACTSAIAGAYYFCPSGSACEPVAVSTPKQIQNPVGLLAPVGQQASDSNGVVINFPSAPPAAGAASVSGSLILGIDTRSNNTLGSASVYTLDPTQGTLTTNYNNQNLTASFIDSGSNALYFADSHITQCTGYSSGFYCPASTLASLTATNQGANGNSGTVSFSVANADGLFANTTYFAFSNLAGTSIGGPPSFDWGLPFFFGNKVFTAIEGTSSGNFTGPYVAY